MSAPCRNPLHNSQEIVMDADMEGLEPGQVSAQVQYEVAREDELVEAQSDIGAEDEIECADAAAPIVHSLMDVLFPASPPAVPKHVRVIRRFDLEAAQFDPRPATEAAAPEKKEASPSREEARALRNRSLRAAAGFF
jgi:hypothetical protein